MFDLSAIAALPDAIVRDDAVPAGRRPRFVATGYGGSVRSSFSGTSAFIAEAGIASGDLDGAFTLYSTQRADRVLQVQGALWKARQALRRESTNGFKFSGRFSAHLWASHEDALAGVDVVNNFQLYSESFFRRREGLGIGAFYYLDGTLHDYLRGYREFDVAAIDPATTDRSVALEGLGYHEADRVIVMCEATAQTLASEYELPRDRIDVILPGANMGDAMAEDVLARRHERPADPMFTVGFVGVYPERKGLPKLAAAIAQLRTDHVPVQLLVVGNCPPDIAAADGVDALGVIDKAAHPDAFAAALARIDLGVQLSTVELFGIAVLEYLRCGIPFLATEVGGIVDILHQGGGLGVPADVSVEQVADTIREVVTNESHRRELERAAARRRSDVRWERAVTQLGEVMARRA